MEDKHIMSIMVTEEQRGLIEAMWAHNDWNLEEVTQTEDHATDDATIDTDPEQPFVIEQREEYIECPQCLCQPCIANTVWEQEWWETTAQAPHETNSLYRKKPLQEILGYAAS